MELEIKKTKYIFEDAVVDSDLSCRKTLEIMSNPNKKWVSVESLQKYLKNEQEGTNSALVCAYLAMLRNEIGDTK
jgi:hypothetical protein